MRETLLSTVVAVLLSCPASAQNDVIVPDPLDRFPELELLAEPIAPYVWVVPLWEVTHYFDEVWSLHVRVMALNGNDRRARASCYAFDRDGGLVHVFAGDIGPGQLHVDAQGDPATLCPPPESASDSSIRDGWAVITSDRPLLFHAWYGSEIYLGGRPLEVVPLDCTAPEGPSHACNTVGARSP